MRMDLEMRRIVMEQRAKAIQTRALVPMKVLQQRFGSPVLARILKEREASMPIFYLPDAPMFQVPLLESFAQGAIVLGILNLERG